MNSATSYFEAVSVTEAYRQSCEDRAVVIDQGDRMVIVVADGAGGIGSGEVAAETVIKEVAAECDQIHCEDDCRVLLNQIDHRIPEGESTGIIIDCRRDGIWGASVGDSQAWIVGDHGITDLTAHQRRKPLLGSGQAHPVSFSSAALNGLLVVGSDGFCNYIKQNELTLLAHRHDFIALPRVLVDHVRLPSGELWDDIAIVCCRVRRRQRTRRRYKI